MYFYSNLPISLEFLVASSAIKISISVDNLVILYRKDNNY